MHIFPIYPQHIAEITAGKPPSVGQKITYQFEGVELILHNTGEKFLAISAIPPGKLFANIGGEWKLRHRLNLKFFQITLHESADAAQSTITRIAESISHVEQLVKDELPSCVIKYISREATGDNL